MTTTGSKWLVVFSTALVHANASAQCWPQGGTFDPAQGITIGWDADPGACCHRWSGGGPGIDIPQASSVGAPASIPLNGLAYGSTYTFGIESSPDGVSWGGWCTITFTTIPGPAANDEACNATPIEPGNICIPVAGTLADASGPQVTWNPPGSTPDVWYSFVAEGPYTTVKLRSLGEDLFLQVFDAFCDEIVINSNTPWQVYVPANEAGYINTDEFIAGQTYFIRVSRYVVGFLADDEFEICIYNGAAPNDCAGTPGGPVVEGYPCDDQNPCTINDVLSAFCTCNGQFLDGDQDGVCDAQDVCPNGPDPGQACEDGDPCTLGFVQPDCSCLNTFLDPDNDGLCSAFDPCPFLAGLAPGDACDDNNPNTGLDVVTQSCTCQGQFIDCAGVPGGMTYNGAPCDDGEPATVNDTWIGFPSNFDGCFCYGDYPVDCTGIQGGQAQPGAFCEDGDPCTYDTRYDLSCTCSGGASFTDSDADGACDVIDGCPQDPGKITPGQCGCGVPDTDSDADGVADCVDNCPDLAGAQGDACTDNNACTTGDVITTDCVCAGTFQDADGDGVCNANDNCPALPGVQGAACNDNDACTINDVITVACVCAGTLQDSDGDGTCDANDPCPFLADLVNGDACNDGNAITVNDQVLNCVCAGELPGDDCLGQPGGAAQPGTACDDNDVCTVNDVYGTDCACVGTLVDADGDGICDASDSCPNVAGEPGDACDDNNGCTTNDVITADCGCAGTFADADADGICDANDDCPTQPGAQGDACNDNDACTTNDAITADCMCAGTLADADADGTCDANDSCPNTSGQQGDACNDNNACTTNDVITADCACAGTFADADNDGTCDANDDCPSQPGVQGDACDDNNAFTSGDVIQTDCSCRGYCSDDLNGPGLIGSACNDGAPDTETFWSEVCACTVGNVSVEQAATGGQFAVHPNPLSTGLVTITTANPWPGATLQVFDLSGRALRSVPLSWLNGRTATVDLSGLSAGGYVLRVQGDGRSGQQRLMVQH